MALVVQTPPAAEPVSLTEAKLHCRIDSSAEDTTLAIYIKAAREYCEMYRGEALVTQTLVYYLDRFPTASTKGDARFDGDAILMPRWPLQSVSTLFYVTPDGVATALAGSAYAVQTYARPGRLRPVYGTTWPATRDGVDAVAITYVAGYGNSGSDVPARIREAILLLVGHQFRNREAVNVGNIINEFPLAVRTLLNSDRLLRVA